MAPLTRANKLKRSHSPSPSLREIKAEDKLDLNLALPSPDSPQKSKKQKLQSAYVTESPFPTFPHPTPTAAQEVYSLLSREHPGKGTRRPPRSDNDASGTCGSVPNVISSLIGTILSQNTSNKNSSRAKASLDRAFGKNNFGAIASAPYEDVVEAIRSGGLANKKARTIQNVLNAIKERHGAYSLQHLAGATDGKPHMSDDEIMQELISYDGVGPKTASCVLLFCLERDSFAVDTHVFRLSKLLGWVPQKADRVLAQAHLDHRVPNDLKYGLHVLMITHGRACKGCKKAGASAPCVLKTYLKESRSQVKTETEVDREIDTELEKLEEDG